MRKERGKRKREKRKRGKEEKRKRGKEERGKRKRGKRKEERENRENVKENMESEKGKKRKNNRHCPKRKSFHFPRPFFFLFLTIFPFPSLPFIEVQPGPHVSGFPAVCGVVKIKSVSHPVTS